MDLQELIARVEAATSTDRELDEQIAMRVAGFKPTIRLGHEILGNLRDVPAHSPRYTESLDCVLALVERVLPGWAWEVKLYPGETGAFAQVWVPMQPRERDVKAPTPALALLAAMLRALPTEAKTNGE